MVYLISVLTNPLFSIKYKSMVERLGNKLRPTEQLDVAVIGAGVIGLSIARILTKNGREVIVFEKENAIGTHSSSRNSEVIHSGIYYNPDSLKASLCVKGNKTLYEYCEENEIPAKRVGKIIVAITAAEIPRLEELKTRGEINGVYDLSLLTPREVKDLEPMITCVNGLFSPSTGIIDSHQFILALRRDVQREGVWIQVLSPVVEGEVQADGIALVIGGNDNTTVICNTVINCAGLYAQNVANKIAGLPKETIPESHFAKGHYFILRGNSPFSHLVYPLPVSGGLGIHVTLDMAGKARFGPDVSWVDEVEYSFDETRAKDFYDAIRRYYPSLRDGDLQPGYTGIRPKLEPAGSPEQDFMIQGPREHTVPGLINLYGIDSPGLTASLALAEYVASIFKDGVA